jgi:preprotein translocase subunit SecA
VSLPRPGVVWGEYPERPAAPRITAAGALRNLRCLAGGPRIAPYAGFAQRVEALANGRGFEPEQDLPRLTALRRAGLEHEESLAEAFAIAGAAMESRLGLKPHATQVMAARILLDDRLAEMATGEGKTLAIALAAAIAALGETPVHVITANDYLAARDAAEMAPFFSALGLAAGVVTQPLDMARRRLAYACPIAYCTAKELVFDYLRDRMLGPGGLGDLERRARRLTGARPHSPVSQAPLLRGLCMAIVDEADTVLIDEAGVPLVLSQPAGPALEHDFLADAARLACALTAGDHFELRGTGGVALTGAGRARLADWPASRHAIQNDPRHREETLCLALTARHLLARDRDYVVREGRIAMVDETTGRTAPGRAWSRGLHQLVEIKEGVASTQRNETVSQITYQRFFPRYLRLAGMSGTVRGAAWEMSTVYGLESVVVPPRLPSLRVDEPLTLHADSEALWRAVAARTRDVHALERPVLIGTASVAQSERLSAVLTASGLDHVVLNARQDREESAVIAAAGERGRITVATSMAGRGSDIRLGEGVAALGGLHVILCQHNASRRIDRQFLGRAARRGEAGSTQAMLALDSELFERWLPLWWRNIAASGLPLALLRLTAVLPQWLAAYTRSRQRHTLRGADEETERELTFHRETHP